jgi:LPPG:FO 2-phospho-L-lactate transferase
MAGQGGKVLALSGGVGGAKLALGLQALLPAADLHVLVNTADDFEHLGLYICPDIDTLLYTLSGKSDTARGWGLADESWRVLEGIAALGGETWFQLGDRDLATHLWRTHRLAEGADLLAVTAELAAAMGIDSTIHPMTADRVATRVQTGAGELAFQHYFVREQCAPAVSGFRFDGIESARPNARVLAMLDRDEFDAVVICPSNPYVSIDPILAMPGMWQALRDTRASVTLVSPIVAGLALKGPAAKMMSELAVPVTALGVADHYANAYPGLVRYFVIDDSDATLAPGIERLGMQAIVRPTVMRTLDDKRQLAADILALY